VSDPAPEGERRGEELWRFALEAARLGVWDADLAAGRCYYSSIWTEMLGYREDEIGDEADTWLNLVHPDDRDHAVASGKAHEEGRVPVIETEFRMRHKDGHWVWVLDRGKTVERDSAGRPTRMIGVQTEITKQKEAERHLTLLNERIRLAVEAGGVGLWQWEIATPEIHWDERMHELYGTDPESFVPSVSGWLARVHPEDRDAARARLEVTLEEGSPFDLIFRIVRSDGIRHIHALARLVSGRDLPPVLLGTNWDVTDQVRAAQALADEKERLRIVLQSIAEAVVCTDLDGDVTFINEAAAKLMMCSAAATIGQPLSGVYAPIHEETGEPLQLSTRAAISEKRTIEGEEHGVLVRPDGSRHAIRDLASPLVTTTGETLGSVLVIQDITASRALQRDLAYAASHDALTGLKSRMSFRAALGDALEEARATGAQHALLFVDLDRFKAINDTAGHAAGDAVLKSVGGILKSAVRTHDVIARLGGDEFALLLTGCGPEHAERIAGKIIALVSAERFQWGGKVYELGASVGIAMIDSESEGVEGLLTCADVACYSAKAAGRNRSAVYRSESGDAHHHLSELQVASGIREAIAQNRFCLYAQEIRDLRSPLKRGYDVEILTRMLGPDGAVIRPGAFIPAAERFDLMGPHDRWVISTALRHFAPAIMSVPKLRVAINLSANSLSEGDLWSFVKSELDESGLAPDRIGFEITETALINNYASSERFVAQAREQGCRIGLDDFGTGVSSFRHLKRFPVDAIKIDGALIRSMSDGGYDRAIVRAIGEIADEIGVDAIAEGIEDTATVEILQSIGIRYGQGHLFHRPRPLEEVISERGGRLDQATKGLKAAG
jgi:diguanylate cyclase (GGDEF)-like protein/PAS domain S-box-containing protein